jgi:hypothetical protein
MGLVGVKDIRNFINKYKAKKADNKWNPISNLFLKL